MDYRINPHFQNPELAIIAQLLLFILSLIMLRAYLINKNILALIFAAAAWSMIAGYAAPLLGYYLYPHNIVIQSWLSDTVAEMFFFTGWTFFTVAGAYLNSKKVPVTVALFVLGFGIISVLGAIKFFQPMEFLPDGSTNFHRTFLIDFSQYLLGVVMLILYAKTILNAYKKVSNKIAAFTTIAGFGIAVISANTMQAASSAKIVILLQYGMIVGISLIIIGFIWTSRSQPRLQS